MNPHKSSSFSSNASPAWGSPALQPNASFPPSPLNSTPHRSPRHPGNRHFSAGPIPGSPQFQGMGFQGSFRTPQPHPRHQSPNSPRGSWSDGKGNRGRPYQRFDGRRGSPHHSPNFNPGGSDNIKLYCSPSMLEDPWSNCPPKPMDYWKK